MPKLRARDRPKRADAAGNARSRKVTVLHAGKSRALWEATLDGRSKVGKAVAAEDAVLRAHVGLGALSRPLETLCHQAARLKVIGAIAWHRLETEGVFLGGEPHPALSAFREAARDEREVLRLLGLERRAKELPTLAEYLRQKEQDPPA